MYIMTDVVGWIGLGMAILAHLVGTVIWATRMSTILDILRKTLEALSFEMKTLNKEYVGKEEFSREMIIFEKENAAIWKNIDEIKKKEK